MSPSLTPEEEQFILDWYKEHPMPEQDENGVDIGQLRENLKLTPAERLDRLKRRMRSAILRKPVLEKLHEES